MALTKDFSETVRARAARDSTFRHGLLSEAVGCLLAGEVGPGKIVLRNYINATIGFEQLATLTGIPAKSLMRMFGPNGNPLASNLFDVIAQLQRADGVHVQVSVAKTTSRGSAKRVPGPRRTHPAHIPTSSGKAARTRHVG